MAAGFSQSKQPRRPRQKNTSYDLVAEITDFRCESPGHPDSLWEAFLTSVQFSSVVSHSLQTPGLPHSKPPCPSPSPGMSTELVMPSYPLTLCCPLLLLLRDPPCGLRNGGKGAEGGGELSAANRAGRIPARLPHAGCGTLPRPS